MIKKLTLIMLVLTLTLSVFNCGGDKKADGEVTITIAAGAVGNERTLTKKAVDLFMAKNPKIKVKVLDTPDLADDRLGLYLQFLEAQSTELDVLQIDVIWPGDLAEHFVDLYQYEGFKTAAEDHFEAIVENNTVDGKLVGMPWFTDAGLLYYRKDLLDKYNLSPPQTWEELETTAKTIQEGERKAGNKDFWGFVWQGNSYEGLTCDALEWVYSNGGGTIVSTDKKITINNPKAIAAIEMAAKWVGTISPNGVTAMGEEESRNLWQAGNAAFMRNWPYAYTLGQADDSKVKGKFDVSPLPAGDGGNAAATLGGWQLAVSKYSKNPEAAAKLVLFLTGPEVQKLRAVEGSFNPTLKALYEDNDIITANPYYKSLYDVFINAVARPSTATSPKYADTSKLFYKAVYAVITGKQDGATAMKMLEKDLQNLLGFQSAGS